MTQREIDDERREILESDKFGEMFLEDIQQNLTAEQAGILGRYIVNCDSVSAGLYIITLFQFEAEKTVRWIQEAK